MSNKKSETEKTQKKDEKVVTRYDRRIQKRKEQEDKDLREDRMTTIVGILIVAALVCLIASFPIRTYLTIHEKFIEVGGRDITKIEFDYNYNIVLNNYLNQNSAYLSYLGLNINQDLSTQYYTQDLTWEDFFQEAAVEGIQRNQALKAEAEAAGFTYDVTEEYKQFEDSVKEYAKQQGISEKEYLKSSYGSYATLGRISDFVKDAIYVSAYYNQVSDERTPSEEEIQTYYNENKDSYDSVDYRLTTVNAVLPTEPTELADTTDDANSTDGSEGTQGEAEEETYQPSEAEIEAAMAEAKIEADTALKTVAQSGELMEGMTRSEIRSSLTEWLFDASRKKGDTTVIEDSSNHAYYVLAFENRYLDETPTIDARVITSTETDGQTILDEWKNGDATEDSFGELCSKYSEDTGTKDSGGLYEALVKDGMSEEMSQWLFAEERVSGDTTAVTAEDGTHYIMYFVSKNKPQWQLGIRSTLLNTTMNEYLNEITEKVEVVDKKGNLHYLEVYASQEAESSAAAEESENAENTESTENIEATDETGNSGDSQSTVTTGE